MTTTADVVRALMPALIVGVACYVLLRWAAVSLLTHLETGMEYAVNVLVIGLLLPEYCWTRAQRRVSGHAAPFAYTYGDAVCTVASAGHHCVSTVLSALREAAGRLGHRGALWGGLMGVGALLWSSWP
ncbi:hypothetical protein ACFU76_08490 [Streptomyces sp. NPDC057539]|uniref:hypothetical protein n=1 Tax=Streptomyces sp. NPDC057539 TaxID=3346159 RepID=UPI00369AC643